MRVALGTSKPDTPPRNRTLFQAGFAHKPLIFALFRSSSAIFAIPDNITADSQVTALAPTSHAYPYLYGLDRFCPPPTVIVRATNERIAMTNAQLELSFGARSLRSTPTTTRRASIRNPQWWFQRMRQIVDRALDWQPA